MHFNLRRLLFSLTSLCTVFAFVFTVLVYASPGFAQVAFQPSVHSSPVDALDVFTADLNNDGHPDVVTAQATNTVSVYINNGDGTFPAGPTATYSTGGAGVSALVVADFNGDGIPDIATANCGNSPDPPQQPVPASVSILFGTGNSYQPHVDYLLPACPDSIGTLKVVNTTLPSLVVSYSQNTITLLRNNGTGTFTEQTITGLAGTIVGGVSGADYNGDGRADIAAVTATPGNLVQNVAIFYGNADGSFAPPTTVFSTQGGLLSATTVGFNATGRPDLLVPFVAGANSTNGVIALANNGGGNFSAVQLNVASQYINIGRKPAEADFQGNGQHTVVLPVAYSTSTAFFSAFALFTQTSPGVWSGPTYVAGDFNGTSVSAAVADFNGDKKPDFAAAGGEDSHMFIFQNAPNGCSFINIPGGVHICSPTSDSTFPSPVSIVSSGGAGDFPVVAMKAYIDGVQVAATDTNTLNASVAKAAGTHQLAINAWDSNDKVFQTIVSFTIGTPTTTCSAPASAGVKICSPLQGATVGSPVTVSAAANGGAAKISAMKAYIDGTQVASSTSGTISASIAKAAGSHNLTVNAWNTGGALFQSVVTFTVH